MRKIAVSQYFKIINPEYIYLKLTPIKSLRNYDSDKIIKAIASMYKSLIQRICKINKQYFFSVPCKVSYYIYLEKNNVEFYFILPKNYMTLLKEKIADTWKSITIEIVENIPLFGVESLKYYLVYKNEDALSLSTDKRENVLLSSLLSVIDVMEQDDRIGVFYNFVPTSQANWRVKFDRTMEKLKEGIPIEKDKFGALYLIKMMVQLIIITADMIRDSVALSAPIPTKKQSVPLSQSTIRKRDSLIVKSQILCLSESKNGIRQQNNATAICESFKSISGDNELIYRKMGMNFSPLSLNIKGAETMRISPVEGQNLLALPGRELLEEHKCITHIDTLETEVPEELQSGIIRLGTNTYKGTETQTFVTTDKEYKNLALVIIGPTRSGKTTLISNIAKDTVSAGECTILFDFCGNCELSDEVCRFFNNKLVIDCSTNIQGLGYNEVKPSNDIFTQYKNAKMQTMQLLTLIDSIAGDSELSSRMDRYLECAAIITFITGGGIRDVFRCLTDFEYRNKLIERVPSGQIKNTEEYVSGLLELNDNSQGTKIHLVTGILDRVNKLKQNAYLELMLKTDCDHNFNFIDEIQRSQLICLKMPESMFATEREKDVYCTYWFTKIWLSLQLRKQQFKILTKCNVVVDELYQIPSCQDFIRSKLSQMAKFWGKMIISCHYLGQIDIIRNELKAANSSYMLLSGSDKDNFKELKDELYPYVVEDVLSLKRYHSLNLVKYEQGYARFITKLPPPLQKRKF